MNRLTSYYLKFIALALLFSVSGCTHFKNKKSNSDEYYNSENQVKFAKGFALFKNGDKTKVVIYSPWDRGKIMATYILVRGIPGKSEIHIPLNRVAVFSATQINAFQKLGIINSIVGVSDIKYLKNKEIQKRYKNQTINELAIEGNFFVEKIIATHPDALFYSPYQGSQQLSASLSGIIQIPFFDFMESNPLGRAEWIKFTAAFFGKQKTADSIFNQIVINYQTLCKLTEGVQHRPLVFSDKFYNGQWYVPGGDSYIASLFRDAGADYVWKEIRKTGGFPLDFESVFKKAGQADFWRIVGSKNPKNLYKELSTENKLYTHFKAFQLHHVIYCNATKTAYFEKGSLEPQVLLSDLIKAFHPELLKDYQPRYYKIIQ